MRVLRHWVNFSTPSEKAKFLDAAASLDAAQPAVLKRARELALVHLVRSPKNSWVGALFTWVRDNIAYVEDRKHPNNLADKKDGERAEEFADSSTILARGFDDCDGKTRLFVALVRALRVPDVQARIKPVFDGAGEFVHAQAEARWPGSERHPKVQAGGWVMADPIVRNAALGDSPTEVQKKPGGGWWIY